MQCIIQYMRDEMSIICWDNVVDAAAAIGFVTMVVNIFICWLTFKAKKKEISMSLLHNLVTEMNTSDCFNRTFYLFEYNEPWYHEGFHEDYELQHKVDAALAFLNGICYFKMGGYLDQGQFRFFEYRISRTWQDKGVRDYMYNLYHFSQHAKEPQPFAYLYDYAMKNSLLPAEFHNRNSKNFPQYLNFPRNLT